MMYRSKLGSSKWKAAVIAASICWILLPAIANAATEAEKQAAIDAGLAWLAGNQNADGSWPYNNTVGTNENTAATGAALLSFLEEGHLASTATYGTNVQAGLDYIFSRAQPVNIGVQTAGNPDTDGNGIGVKFVPGGANGRDTYVTGLVVPALTRTGTPNALITTGPLVGRVDGSGPGGAWTYQDAVVNAIDYFAWGQNDAATGVNRGGWRYSANSANSDQSTAQWPILSDLFAGGIAPAFVGAELQFWIDAIQYTDGGAEYTPGGTIAGVHSNHTRTGALLAMMAYNGYPSTDADLQAALDWIDANWQDGPSSTWNGNFGHPYAMWAVYKGLETTIGLEDTTAITSNLPDPNTYRGGGPVPLDPGDTWNWWENYTEFLVNGQLGDGSWNGYNTWNSVLATPWYINILAATRVDPAPPEDIPEAASIFVWGLLGLTLAGATAWRRRRQE